MKLLFPLLLLFFVSACQIVAPSKEYIDQGAVNELVIEAMTEEEGLTHLIREKQSTATSSEIDGQAKHNNIWLKLADGFEFDVPENSRIAKQRDYYLRHPNYLKQVSKRAEPFLYLIIEQIEAKNLPLELALLPIVESAFDPFAYSPASASGLWQFMPATGDRFGLQQDWWYDGRRDVYASTSAALLYMEILHNYLGDDWLYAFAAYNSGEGRVKRAVQKNRKANKPVDYWHLSLPRETQQYVPKLLALVDILRNHKKYGVELPYISNEQVLTYIDTGSQLDLAYGAQLANLSLAEIQLLNPAFNHWATSPDGPHNLLIPTIVASSFSQKLAATDKSDRVRWTRYKVRSGDSLSVIAQKNATTTAVLKQINEIKGSFIRIGQALLIPVGSGSQQNALYAQAKRFKSRSHQGKHKIIHTIVEGDTLWDISRLYKVTTKDIASWNQIKSSNTLRLGMSLTIWRDGKQTRNAYTRRVTYKVRSGDSLGLIAQKFNVKIADLVSWNKLQKQKYIKPGQKLLIHIDVRKSRSQIRRVTYKVRSGDSLGLIAQKFNVKIDDLVSWNKLKKQKYIKPGQKLLLHIDFSKSSS